MAERYSGGEALAEQKTPDTSSKAGKQESNDQTKSFGRGWRPLVSRNREKTQRQRLRVSPLDREVGGMQIPRRN